TSLSCTDTSPPHSSALPLHDALPIFNNVVEPALHQLVKETGESASFYVREGDIRSCVARVEGPQSVRHNVRIGERLPLNKGAPRSEEHTSELQSLTNLLSRLLLQTHN